MSFNSLCKEKLSKLLFLEINYKEFLKELGVDYREYDIEELYIPINPKHISEDISNNYKLNNIPIYYFVEGMFFALGADKNLKFNKAYKQILPLIKDSIPCIKKVIADRIKEDKLVDSIIFLKGLSEVSKEKDVYNKLLLVCEALREKNNEFNEIQLDISEEAKHLFQQEAFPYLFAALAYNNMEKYQKAFVELNEYLARNGEKSEFIEALYDEIKDSMDYENGKEALLEEPNKALERLLPLADKFEDNSIVRYYIGTAYRRLDNYEKAIYYLNESFALDQNMVETVNELGLNYALLHDYDTAIKYFKKAFEATKDVEICTNLIMCYINLGDKDNAKKHLELAKAIKKDDEIVFELERYINNLK